MPIEAIRRLIQRHLDLIEYGLGSVEANEQGLVEILDRLAVAIHDAPPGDVTGEADAPERDYNDTRSKVAVRFPNYGFYFRGEQMNPSAEPVGMLYDAIDDITDIALDLFETAWLWDHLSPADGLWMYHLGFNSHWGDHLRQLQAHLHDEAQSRSLGSRPDKPPPDPKPAH